jgi:hypothetical protein
MKDQAVTKSESAADDLRLLRKVAAADGRRLLKNVAAAADRKLPRNVEAADDRRLPRNVAAADALGRLNRLLISKNLQPATIRITMMTHLRIRRPENPGP